MNSRARKALGALGLAISVVSLGYVLSSTSARIGVTADLHRPGDDATATAEHPTEHPRSTSRIALKMPYFSFGKRARSGAPR